MRILLLKNLTDKHGRKYKKEDVLFELMKFDKPLIGEVGSDNSSTVNLSRASHTVSNITFDKNNDLYGDLTILNNPIGDVLSALVAIDPNAIRMGMRGTGTLNKNNEVSDFKLITFDIYKK